MNSFDPTTHHFIPLPSHNPAPGVKFYEYQNSVEVDGKPNYQRLNTYLSQDGDFVTVWYGPLESIFLQSFLEKLGIPFHDDEEKLFRGWIESNEQAVTILTALRFDKMRPHVYEQSAEGKIICRTLDE